MNEDNDTFANRQRGEELSSCQYSKAVERFEAALVIAREMEDREGECEHLDKLGLLYNKLGLFNMAVEKYEAALLIARDLGDLGTLGDIYVKLERYVEAAESYEALLVRIKEYGDKKKESICLGLLGNIYFINLRQYEMATQKSESALVIAQEIGDKDQEELLLNSLGIMYRSLGQYNKAARKLEAALFFALKKGDRRMEGSCLGSLGIVRRNLGQYDKAAESYEKALKIARTIKDRHGEGSHLCNLGKVYDDLGQYDKATAMLEKGLKIAREIKDRHGEGSCLGNLGLIDMRLGRYNDAVEKLETAIEIAQDIRDSSVVEGAHRGNLGIAYMRLGEYEKAAKTFEAALADARKVGDRNREALTLGNLGNAYKELGKYDEVTVKYEEALKIAREIGDRKGEGSWLGCLGVYHYTKSDNHQQCQIALDYLKQSIQVFDDLWKNIEEDDKRVTFDDVNGSSSLFSKYLHSVYWNIGQFVEALETCEQASSKSLDLLLLENQKGKIAVNDSFEQKNQSLVTLPAVTNFEKMRNVALQNKSAIIVYDFHVEGDILIWVIKNGYAGDARLMHQKVPVKKKYKSLQHLVELTRRSIGARDRKHSKRRNKGKDPFPFAMPIIEENKNLDDFNDVDLQAIGEELRKAQHVAIEGSTITLKNALRELYDLLILPIEHALVNEQRLTIIPSGDLFALPFAALLDRNGKYLIENYVLSFAPSIGTLVKLEENRTTSKSTKGSTVVVGTGAHLPGARSEAEEVYEIVTSKGQRKAHKFIGKDATKEKVVNAIQSADIIHLATHGSKDGIFLSGPTGEDVKLTMGEVQRLGIRGTKMIVLSACDTFKGDLRTDGVVGITRAFLAAGSSTVIASLWPVNDNSTKKMMIRLYNCLFNTGDGHEDDGSRNDISVDVSYALQQVMIGMLNEKFDLKEWAPFLVYGLNTSLDG